MPTKTCSQCSIELPLESFYTNARYAQGVVGICKGCCRKNNRVTARTERTRAFRKAKYHTRREYFHLKSIKYRAKCKGLDFDLDESDLVVPEVCPLLGIPLQRGSREASPNSPTVDRIDPKRGYVKGNVWVISRKANSIKQDATVEEIRAVAEGLERLLTLRALSTS